MAPGAAASLPIVLISPQKAIDSLTDDQITSIAETILSRYSRGYHERPMFDANKFAFDTEDTPSLASGGSSRTQDRRAGLQRSRGIPLRHPQDKGDKGRN